MGSLRVRLGMYVGASYLYVSWPGSSDNDDGQFARGRLGFARFQDLMRAHEADLLAVQPEVLAAFYRFDLVRGKLQRPENRSEREGVGSPPISTNNARKMESVKGN